MRPIKQECYTASPLRGWADAPLVATHGGHVERRRTRVWLAHGLIDACAGGQDKSGALWLIAHAADEEHRPPIHILRARIRVCVEQRPRHLHAPGSAELVQRAVSAGAKLDVEVRACSDQDADAILVAVSGREDEWWRDPLGVIVLGGWIKVWLRIARHVHVQVGNLKLELSH